MNENDSMPREDASAGVPVYGRIIKPVIDFLLALILFILTLIPMLVLAAMVGLTVGSPALVRVKCSGKNGVIFTRHDFRTVTRSYGEWEQEATDSRIGSLGRWLRRSGMYRLPNLINCLKLEMSLTGPRPLDSAYYYRYGEDEFSRLRVRPGVFTPDYTTCESWEELFESDSRYIGEMGIKTDASLFFKGIGRVFKGRCADNIPEEWLGEFSRDALPYVSPRKTEGGHQLVLMLTIDDVDTVKQHTPFCDLAREYLNNGHSVVIVSPSESSKKEKTHFIGDPEARLRILKVRTANFRSVGLIGQYIAAVTLDRQVRHAAAKYLNGDIFDTIINFAPPYAMDRTCGFIAKRDSAQCIYMAGDRNAKSIADIGTVRENTVLHNILRGQEERMYWLADRIVCGSEPYRKWLLTENKWLDASRVEVIRTGLDIQKTRLRPEDKIKVREHFDLPRLRKIFICTGALDDEHDADAMINCIYTLKDMSDVYVVLTGSGEKYPKVLNFFQKFGSFNVNLMPGLTPHEIELLLGGSDVGLLFDNYRQTVPTFPADTLYYMQAGLPILAVTDERCAVKDLIEKADIGCWACSDDPGSFELAVKQIKDMKLDEHGKMARDRLRRDFTVQEMYKKLCPAAEMSETEQSFDKY